MRTFVFAAILRAVLIAADSYAPVADDDHMALGTDFGVRQYINDERADEIIDLIHRTIDYIYDEVLDEEDEELPEYCWNDAPECSHWAAIGRCSDEDHRHWMEFHCAPACQTCATHEHRVRCALDPDGLDAMAPGDLHRMFQEIVTDEGIQTKYNVTALSRPRICLEDEGEEGDDVPWIVMFDNLLSSDECDEIVDLAGGWSGVSPERILEDGEWREECGRFYCEDGCDEAPVMDSLRERIEHLTGIPRSNLDFMQILRYVQHQQLATHHDYVDGEADLLQGSRLLTVNLYLSDVEEGGGTNFPFVNNLTVHPKKGRMVVWPNVLNESPSVKDDRTVHRSIPVSKGKKYGGNICIYNRDFREARNQGCT